MSVLAEMDEIECALKMIFLTAVAPFSSEAGLPGIFTLEREHERGQKGVKSPHPFLFSHTASLSLQVFRSTSEMIRRSPTTYCELIVWRGCRGTSEHLNTES